MDLTFFEFLLLSFASFRLTRLLVYDQITEFIRRPFMLEVDEEDEHGKIETYIIPKNKGIAGFFGKLLSCYWCTGIWSAMIIYLMYAYFPTIGVLLVVILSISALAAIIEGIIQKMIIQ